MIKQNGLADVYTDFKGVNELRNRARKDPQSALAETAKQFESVFLQMALKSMRNASMQSGLIDSQQTGFYRDMYDQQLAVELGTQSKLGLADMVVQQLGGKTPANGLTGKTLAEYRQNPVFRVNSQAEADRISRAQAARSTDTRATAGNNAGANENTAAFESRRDFVEQLWPHAQEAAAELGIDPKLLVAQAALETGWGKSLGRSSGEAGRNLFGIKADHGWNGSRTVSRTLEFVDGIPTRTRAAFRAYGSYAESFRDYVSFLKNNPRYANALQHTANPERFMSALQKAGYATDPAYARKVLSIYNGPTLEQATVA